MRDEVGSNGIHSYNYQREGPSRVILHGNEPREGRQKEEADAAAEEGPTRRPDALDDGTDSGEVKQQAGAKKNEPRDEETADRYLRRRGAEPLAGHQPKQHGSKRGNEAQREVAA